MKELIPPLRNIRVLYIFDPERRAVLLLGAFLFLYEADRELARQTLPH